MELTFLQLPKVGIVVPSGGDLTTSIYMHGVGIMFAIVRLLGFHVM